MSENPTPLGSFQTDDPKADERIAIVGMSCLYPKSPNVDTYWQNILGKVDCTSDIEDASWLGDYHNPQFDDDDDIYTARGGYIDELATFDPLKYKIPPRSVAGEPDQWLALKLAEEALADANCLDLDPDVRRKTGIVLGKGTYLNGGNATAVQRTLFLRTVLRLVRHLHPEWGDDIVRDIKASALEELPEINADTVAALIPNITVGRVANRMDFMGPAYTVDAACSSSLLALQAAKRHLLAGECDIVLAGGAQVWIPAPTQNLFCRIRALSPTGVIRPMDANADGTLLGEGIGMVVLKRLADAERDGDRIYCTLRGVGVSSDGKEFGVMAPRTDGQVLATQRAYEDAGVPADSIQLLEVHGTGTLIGDATEINTLHTAWAERAGDLPDIAVGTVKSQISHTIPASGIAGVIKLALALHHRVLPPTINVDQPNPALVGPEKSPFYVNAEARPWTHTGFEPRRAGINAFGFGGINAHAVLEEYIHPSHRVDEVPTDRPDNLPVVRRDHVPDWESEVFALDGATVTELEGKARQLADKVAKSDDTLNLTDLAAALASQIDTKNPDRARPARLAIVAKSTDDLVKKLNKAADRMGAGDTRIKGAAGVFFESEPLAHDKKVALMFPGEGSQYPGMLQDLCLHFPEVLNVFDIIDGIGQSTHGGRVSDTVFPRAAFTDEEKLAHLASMNRMDVAVEAVMSANHACERLLERLGVDWDLAIGHSTGENSAAMATGTLGASLEAMSKFSSGMFEAWSESEESNDIARAVLFAVGAGKDAVQPIIDGKGPNFIVAMDNCPHQTVLAGPAEESDAVKAGLEEAGLIFEVLPFDRAVHTPRFETYAERLRSVFAEVGVSTPSRPFWSCTHSAPMPDDPEAILDVFVEHWMAPVEFSRTIEKLHAEEGVGVFIECGARGMLTAFVDDILRGKEYCAVPVDTQRRSGIGQLNRLVAQLLAHSVSFDFGEVFNGRVDNELDLDTLPLKAEPAKNMERRLLTSYAELQMRDVPESLRKVLPAFGGVPALLDQDGNPVHPGDPGHPGAAWEAGASASAPNGSKVADSGPSNGSGQASNGSVGASGEITNGIGAPSAPAPTQTSATPTAAPISTTVGHGQQAPAVQPAAASPAVAPQSGAVAAEVLPANVAALQAHLNRMEQFLDVQAIVTQAHLQQPQTAPGPQAFVQPSVAQPHAIQPAAGQPSPAPLAPAPTAQPTTEGPDAPVAKAAPVPAEPANSGVRDDATARAVNPKAARQSRPMPVAATSTDRKITDLPSSKVPREDIISRSHPWIGLVTEWEPMRRLVSIARADTTMPALGDHRIGGLLAVMPLAMSASLMAQIAVELTEGELLAIENLQGVRWLTVDDGLGISYQLTAEVLSVDDEGVYRIKTNLTAADGYDLEAATDVAWAEVLVGSKTPAPIPPKVVPEDGPASLLEPEMLYRDVLFHGPVWQGVTDIKVSGSKSVVGGMKQLDTAALSNAGWDRPLALDPIALDAAGQLIGFWTCEKLDKARVVFPYHLERLELYGATPEVGTELVGQADIDCGQHLVHSDIEVLRPDGMVWMRLEKWADRRFDIPEALEGLVGGAAVGAQLSVPMVDVIPQLDDVELRRLDVPVAVQQPLWLEIWQLMLLDHQERLELGGVKLPPKRKAARLASRTAAKEAVVALAADGFATLADVTFTKAEQGGPELVNRNNAAVVPTVSMSSSERIGVAAVRRNGGPIGVDVEVARDLDNTITESTFTEAEMALVAAADGPFWPLRGWSAKEALGKALGSGLPRGPRGLVIERIDSASGQVAMRLGESLGELFPEETDNLFVVETTVHDDLVVAVSTGDKEEAS